MIKISLCWLAMLFLAATTHGAGWDTLSPCRLLSNASNDGDSFHVKYLGKEYIFRLYFVDAVETSNDFHTRTTSQARYFKHPKAEVLPYGLVATDFTRKFLQGSFTVKTLWQDAEGNSKLPRYFAIIEADEGNLSEALVSAGLARIYGIKPPSRWPGGQSAKAFVDHLESLESKAQREKVGIWGIGETKASDGETVVAEGAVVTRSPLKEDKFNLNTASTEQISSLPGVGEKTASLIERARPFESVEELDALPGIGEKTLAGILPFIYLAPEDPMPGTGFHLRANGSKMAGRRYALSVTGVEEVEKPAPTGYTALLVATAVEGFYGGKAIIYVLNSKVDLALSFTDGEAKPLSGEVYRYQDVVGLLVQ